MTTLSPADKAEMIRKYFPALLPYVNKAGDIECPSMTNRGAVHTVSHHKLADGSQELRCSCPSFRRACTHIALSLDLIQGGAPVTIHKHLEMDADFDDRWSHVLRAAS